MMEIKDAIDKAMKQYKLEYGPEATLEEGEEFATVFNDGILILSYEDHTRHIKFLVGKPYFINENLDWLEGENIVLL